MLSFHCKQTDPVVFRKSLERYLVDIENTKAGGKSTKPKKQVLAAFDADITALEQLRNNARNAAAKLEDSQAAIVKYYHALEIVDAKVPFNESEVRVGFTWYDSVHKGKKITSFNVGLELAGMLFNHAALSSQIGASTDRSNVEGLKISCKHFQCAAGALASCRDLVSKQALGPLTVDLSVEALTMMENAMLAQAQHCLCEKAQQDGMKSAILAKLCQGGADLFNRAFSQFSNQQIRTNYNKTWSGLLEMHVHHYRAKVHRHLAAVAHDSEEYGVEITQLRQALLETQKAKELARVANAAHIVQGFLSEIETGVSTTLMTIERDNNLIYNALIPNLQSLPPAESKVMVKSSPLTEWFLEPSDCPHLFQALLPAAAAAALADHQTKLEEMLRKQSELIINQSNNAKAVLAELNLDSLVEDNQETLPKGIQEGIETALNLGGYSHLSSTLTQVLAMSRENMSILFQAKQALDTEETQDRDMRMQFPNMAIQITDSPKINAQLRKQIAAIQAKLEAASDADKKVSAKLETNKDILQMLDLGVAHIAERCPRSGKSGSTTSEAANSLSLVRDASAKLKIVLERRENLRNKLKESIAKDNAETLLLKARPPYTQAFAEALEVHEAIVREIEDNIHQQENHLSVLLEHTPKAKAGQDSAAKARDEYIKGISVGINSHREITENLKEGLEWHTKFQETLNQHLQRCNDFCMSRRLEKQMFAESLSQSFATMTVDAIPSGPPNY